MNYLGINKEALKPIAVKMNELLSSYQIYYQNLRSFHWHIEGKSFYVLHEVFEDLYNDAKVNIDEIAERILTIRYKPVGKLSSYLKMSSIEEADEMMRDDQMVETILQNHSELIKCMRMVIEKASEVGDEGTVDLLAGFIGDLEKKSWMLDAWRSRVFEKNAMA